MLGRLALWKGALLVSRTQAFITGEGGLCRSWVGSHKGFVGEGYGPTVGGM